MNVQHWIFMLLSQKFFELVMQFRAFDRLASWHCEHSSLLVAHISFKYMLAAINVTAARFLGRMNPWVPEQCLSLNWFRRDECIQWGTWKALPLLQLRHQHTAVGHHLGPAGSAQAPKAKEAMRNEVLMKLWQVSKELANSCFCITFNCIVKTQEIKNIREYHLSHTWCPWKYVQDKN